MSFIKTIFKDLFGRTVTRRAQDFNVENRAYKFLDQDKLPTAPRHFTDEKVLKQFLEENPHVKEEVNKKDGELVDNVNKVKVNVVYPPEMKTKNKAKLPKDRHIVPKDTNFKVNDIPYGCMDFEIFLKIYDYKYNHSWSNEEIADEFELDEKNVDDLLFYFKPFNNKIFNKEQLNRSGHFLWDQHYIKMADLLGRDPETQQRIPEYKRELMKVEEENKAAKLFEEMDELDEDAEKEEDERIQNMKFKHEIFFIARQEEHTKRSKVQRTDDKTNEIKKNDESAKKDENVEKDESMRNDEIKEDERIKIKKKPKRSSKKEVKNDESNSQSMKDNLDESKNVKNDV